jgi:uncharacterized protein
MKLKEPLKTFVVSFSSGMAVLIVFFFFLRQSQHDLFSRIESGGYDAFAEYISRNYDVNYSEDRSLLGSAIINNNFHMVDALLTKGADSNKADRLSITPLMLAAFYSDPLIVKMLMEHGAIITNRDSSGDNAVNFAVAGNPESIYLLVSRGANINNANRDGYTPLLSAVSHYEENKRNYISILTLLYLGANINCTNKDGLTPIIIATQHGDTNLVQLLNRGSTGLQHGNSGF